MLWMLRNMMTCLRVPVAVTGNRLASCRTVLHMALHMAVHWACRPRLLWLHVNDMLALRRSRRQLAGLEAHRRADIGVTAAQVEKECTAPLLGEISPWASLELRAAVNAARRPSTPPPGYKRSFYRSRGRGDLRGTG